MNSRNQEVGQSYGVDALSTALTMVIGKNLALMVPATYLATCLANVELKDHMKFSIPWYWAISVIMIVIGVILQIIPL